MLVGRFGLFFHTQGVRTLGVPTRPRSISKEPLLNPFFSAWMRRVGENHGASNHRLFGGIHGSKAKLPMLCVSVRLTISR